MISLEISGRQSFVDLLVMSQDLQRGLSRVVAGVARTVLSDWRSSLGYGGVTTQAQRRGAGARHSRPGGPPASQSGELARSGVVRPVRGDPLSRRVVMGAFYGRFLESGTQFAPAYPSLVPARDRHVDELEQGVLAAIDEAGQKWERGA